MVTYLLLKDELNISWARSGIFSGGGRDWSVHAYAMGVPQGGLIGTYTPVLRSQLIEYNLLHEEGFANWIM